MNVSQSLIQNIEIIIKKNCFITLHNLNKNLFTVKNKKIAVNILITIDKS